MTTNPVRDIAIGVAERLALTPLTLSFTVTRSYRPTVTPEQLGAAAPDDEPAPVVTVVAKSRSSSQATRATIHDDVAVDVGIQAWCLPDDVARADKLVGFVGEVVDLLNSVPIAFDGGASVAIEVNTDPIFDPEMLDRNNVFVSVVTVTYKVRCR
jgi:hypothetical protein